MERNKKGNKKTVDKDEGSYGFSQSVKLPNRKKPLKTSPSPSIKLPGHVNRQEVMRKEGLEEETVGERNVEMKKALS